MTSGKITIDIDAAESTYNNLNAASKGLLSVKKALPGRVSESSAMDKFGDECRESKALFTEYRMLFEKDIETYREEYLKFVMLDEQGRAALVGRIADKAFEGFSPFMSGSGNSNNSESGAGGGGAGGGSW